MLLVGGLWLEGRARVLALMSAALVLVVQGCSGSSFVRMTLINDLLPMHGVTAYQQYARHLGARSLD